LKVASGQRVRQSGPSGKPIWRYPALHEALRAAELLKSTAVTHVTPEPTTAPKAAEEVEPEALRKALAEHIAATTPPVPREIDVIDYSMEPTVDADGGGVTTSPEETAKFDAEIAAKKSNRSDDSKIHPNGFSWLRRRDKASNRGVYDLYNPAGLLCVRRGNAQTSGARTKAA
jgi:hypothetical protein